MTTHDDQDEDKSMLSTFLLWIRKWWNNLKWRMETQDGHQDRSTTMRSEDEVLVQEFQRRLQAMLQLANGNDKNDDTCSDDSALSWHKHPFQPSSNTCPPSKFPYCPQEETWDCGIACLLMLRRWILLPYSTFPSHRLLPQEQVIRRALLRAIHSESIWTPDLMWQLHQLLHHDTYQEYGTTVPDSSKVSILYTSQTFDVSTQDYYSTVGYYQEAFSRDQVRVAATLEKLKQSTSLCLCLPHLPLASVLSAVQYSRCIAMMLVDHSILQGRNAKSTQHNDHQYTGHYVLICGTSQDKDHLKAAQEDNDNDDEANSNYCVVLCNPGRAASPWDYVTPRRLEKSWRALGTDEDVIFVVRST